MDEIWDGSKFDQARVQQLLDYVSGEKNITMDEIKGLAASKRMANSMKTAGVGEKAGKDIVVTFGDLDWTPTYLSMDRDGNPILTLWLSNSTQKAWQNEDQTDNRDGLTADQGQFYGFINGGLYSDWAANWEDDETSYVYPSAMYGTSYIRAVTLNNGGDYALKGGSTLQSSTQDSNSVFAKFTMDDVEGSLTKYIVEPAKVEWQEYQDAKKQIDEDYLLPNEGYQTNQSSSNYNSGRTGGARPRNYNTNYSVKSKYDVWKNDKLWLPSLTEIYEHIYTGIWYISVDQSKNYDGSTYNPSGKVGGGSDKGIDGAGVSGNAYNYSWLRTGDDVHAGGVCYEKHNGASNSIADYEDTDESLAVRPALHLNLTEVVKSAGIVSKDDPSYVSVDELWSGDSFNKANFQKLLDYVAGEEKTNFVNILTHAADTRNAEQMRTTEVADKSDEQDIVVKLGGLEWNVTYLSTDRNGDPILTLWLSNSTQKVWQDGNGGNRSELSAEQGQYYGFLNGGLYSDWAANSAYYTSSSYPSAMYGTSYIRAVTLNNGGDYALTPGNNLQSTTQDETSVFAKFTMDDVEGSLTKYIVEPSQVEWQEYQDAKTLLAEYYIYPNEGYQINQDNTGYTTSGANYSTKDKYDTWKNDKLWLPSITEVGYNSSKIGIWYTSFNQRKNNDGFTTSSLGKVGGGEDKNINNTGVSGDAYAYSWLRTGYYQNYDGVASINPVGIDGKFNRSSVNSVDKTLAVRPALHLDLEKIAIDLNMITWKDMTPGTKEAPYQISSVDDLILLAKDVNNGNSFAGKYFIQTADIRLDGYEWTPIGTNGNPFSGTYDGKGYAINGLTINNTDPDLLYIGLFGYVAEGIIENVTLASGEITTVDLTGDSYMGMVAYARYTELSYDNFKFINNCKNYANFDGRVKYVGGIVGYISLTGLASLTNVVDCTNYGKINGINQTYTGGIAGYSYAVIAGCYNYGDVSVGKYVGGLVGYYDCGEAFGIRVPGWIINCISNATVSGTNCVGSLVGCLNGCGIIQNCAAFGSIEGSGGVLVGELSSLMLEEVRGGFQIEGCSFEGFVVGENNFDKYVGTAGEPLTDKTTITCCYVWINQEGYFTKASDNWSEYFTVLDMPKQKSLYWPAAAVDQTNEEIIAEMTKVLGFTEYVQT